MKKTTIFFPKLILLIMFSFAVISAQAAERHYSLSQAVTYDDNTDLDNAATKSNTSHLSSANISYEDVTSKFNVNVDADFQYVNHSRTGLNDGASTDGVVALRYVVFPGRWSIGLQNLAVYSRDYSELESGGNEDQTNTLSYNTNFNFRLGSSSNISINGDRSRTENEDDAEFDAVSRTGHLTFQKLMSPLISLNLTYSYTDTVQFLNGSDAGVSRLESQTVGITRVFPRSNLLISAGTTSPVGALSDQNDIDNFSFGYRYSVNSKFDFSLLAQKDASTLNSSSTFNNSSMGTTAIVDGQSAEAVISGLSVLAIIDGLSVDERVDLLVDWTGGITTLNLRLYYGESEALSTNTLTIAEIVNLGDASFDDETGARFHGWELSVPSTVSPSLTIVPGLRMEKRQFQGLAVTRSDFASSLESISSVGEIQEFFVSLGVNYSVSTSFGIDFSFERSIADENSISQELSSMQGAVINTIVTDRRPNANVFRLSVQYDI